MLVPSTLLLALSALVAAQLAVLDGKVSVLSAVGITSTSKDFTSESPAALEHSSLGADDTLKLSFSVTQNGEGFQPHQAMVQFLPVAESERTRGHDYLAVVKVRKGGKARWEVDMRRASPSLLSLSTSGDVVATLLVGHFGQTPLALPLGTFTLPSSLLLPFPYPADAALPKAWEVSRYKVMPEMTWTFQAAEKKVNSVIALGGSIVVLAPWVILLGLLGHIKPALNSPTLNILSFLLCIFSFEALVVAYWTSLKLLPTLPYFGALAALTAFTGRKALGDVRKRRLVREAIETNKKAQ